MLTKQEKIKELKDWLNNTQLDSTIVNETIGIKEDHISPQVMLLASGKLIKIMRNEAEPDDRDNLKYYKILGIEDFVHERITKDVGKVQQKFLQKVKQKKNLSFLNSGFFNSQVKSAFVGNPLTQLPEQVNSLEGVDIAHIVTKLGEGAISSSESAPMESRAVHPSYFGFFDPYRVPEDTSVGLKHRVTDNTIKTRDNKLMAIVRDNKDSGKLKWKTHEELLNSSVEVPKM